MKKITAIVSLIIAAGAVATQASTVIDFENGQVTDPGLGFNAGTVGGATDLLSVNPGLSGGDPGNWGIEGNNGAHYLTTWGNWGPGTAGWSGPGDTAYSHIYLTLPNSSTPNDGSVSFNVLLDQYNQPATITFYGFLAGTEVASTTVSLSTTTVGGYTEQFGTVSFGDVDEIRYNNNQPFGMDNFVIDAPIPTPEPGTLALAVVGIAGLLAARRRK